MASPRTALDETNNGAFVRTASTFRNTIEADGKYAPESGRYHLYVSYACPWANRCLIVRSLKGLEPHISVSVTHSVFYPTDGGKTDHVGWVFRPDGKLTCPDGVEVNISGCTDSGPMEVDSIRALYEAVDPTATKFTVPVLFDKSTKTIVNNESSEIIRIFNTAFNDLPGVRADVDLYPSALRAEIDAMNESIYESVNNGVYKCGFATKQAAYDAAAEVLFKRLDELEEHLGKQRFLVGKTLTEADVRLFVTLVRYDEVYVAHFKCDGRRIRELPNLRNYCRDIYQTARIADTVNFEHIKTHYFISHRRINPFGIVAHGPGTETDLKAPHDRARFEDAA